MKLVLDSNIWNKLDQDPDARYRIAKMCAEGELEILAPWTLVREMDRSPWGGFPDWFPVRRIPDPVFLWGYSPWGEGSRWGAGGIFRAHRGKSRKIADSLIADSAEIDADGFVSEDRRARHRYAHFTKSGLSYDYEEFRRKVLGLTDDSA